MYSTLSRYKRQLQRRLSSASDSGSTSVNNGVQMKPLLPETTNDLSSIAQTNSESSSSSAPGNHPSIPTHAYLTLFTAVVALSSIGPSLDLQHGVSPVLKIFWRMTGTWMFLLPTAAYSIFYQDGWPKLNSDRLILTYLGCAFCYTIVCVAFVLALDYTSVGNTVIFSNTHALLLLLGRSMVGSPVSSSEAMGAFVAFAGGVFCTFDASVPPDDPTEPHSAELMEEANELGVAPIWVGCWGDFIALLSAVAGVGYLVLASQIRAKFSSVYLFVFMIMFLSSFFTWVCIVLLGEKVELSRDIHIGLMGFLNTRYDRLPLEMFMVIVCNLTGAMGYVRAMQYFDNIIIAVVTLLEPVVASGLACMVGVGVLPGFLGWVGNVFVAMGTVMVIMPARTSKKQTNFH